MTHTDRKLPREAVCAALLGVVSQSTHPIRCPLLGSHSTHSNAILTVARIPYMKYSLINLEI